MKFIKTRSNITVIADKVYTIGKADVRFQFLVTIEDMDDIEILNILDYSFLKSEKYLNIVNDQLLFNGETVDGNLADILIKQYKLSKSIVGVSNLIFNIENHEFNKQKSYDIIQQYEFTVFTEDGFCNLIINDRELDLKDTPFMQIKDSCIVEEIKAGHNLRYILNKSFNSKIGKKTYNFFKNKIVQDTLNEDLIKFIVFSSEFLDVEMVKQLTDKDLTVDNDILELFSKFIPKKKRLLNALLNTDENIGELIATSEFYQEIKDSIEIPPKKYSIRDIVLFIEREYKRINNQECSELYLNNYDFIRELNTKEFGVYNIVFPDSSFDLIKWGMLMDNCIGGRSQSTISGSKIPFAIFKNGKLLYCVELVKGKGYGDFETYNKKKPSKTFIERLTTFLVKHRFSEYAPGITK